MYAKVKIYAKIFMYWHQMFLKYSFGKIRNFLKIKSSSQIFIKLKSCTKLKSLTSFCKKDNFKNSEISQNKDFYPSDRLGQIYTFTDLLFSLQSTNNSKLHNYEFLVYFSNVSIIYSCYTISFYMSCKI